MMLLNIPFQTLFCQNMPMPPKVKFMKNILKYDILCTIYVFNAKIGHTMHHLWRKITWELDCSVARYSSLKNQTEPILTNNYPLLYINSHVKHGSNLIRTVWVKIQIIQNKCTVIVFGVMVGPYIKSRGIVGTKCRQMQTSSHWRHMYNKGNILQCMKRE